MTHFSDKATKSAGHKVILITGASSGIGYASARALIASGHTVYGAARRVHMMDDLVAAGGHAIRMDVTDSHSVQSGVDRVIDECGRIDGLFANAGYCLLGPVELLPDAEVLKQFDTNVVGVGRAIRAVLPHMRAAGTGTIAICSSTSGWVSAPEMAWYPATKFALRGLSDGLRAEVRDFGINVVLIEPSYVNTPIHETSLPFLDLALRQPGSDAYRNSIKRLRTQWSRGIQQGASANSIAQITVQIFSSRHPKRRYQTASRSK